MGKQPRNKKKQENVLVSVGIALIALVLAFFIKRAKQAEDPEELKASETKVVNKLAEN